MGGRGGVPIYCYQWYLRAGGENGHKPQAKVMGKDRLEKHWRGMRCASAEDARGLIVSMPRRSWGMAASRLNARPVIRRLQHVSGAKVPGHIVSLSRVRRRFRRRRDCASEHFGRNNRHSWGVHQCPPIAAAALCGWPLLPILYACLSLSHPDIKVPTPPGR